jgi:hypothetical protein
VSMRRRREKLHIPRRQLKLGLGSLLGVAFLLATVSCGGSSGTSPEPEPTSNASPTPAPMGSPTPRPGPTPTPSPVQTPSSPTPAPTPTASGNGGGTVVITVPTPSPILCTPTPIAVAVGQEVTIDCTASDYGGAFTWTVTNQGIASVQQFNSDTFTYFKVMGLSSGTTTVAFQSPIGNTGSFLITVSP